MQHDLVLRAERREGIFLVHLAGVVDAHTLDKFEAGLKAAIEKGAESIILDFDELRYVNSAGFGELIRYFDRLKERGGTLVLTRVPPKVGVILEMLGLKSIIPVTSSIEAAFQVAAGRVVAPAPPTPGPRTPSPASRRGLPSNDVPAPPVRSSRPVLTADKRTVVCAFCDSRLRIGGEGRWSCAGCGAPFTITREGGLAFDWSRADAEAVHLTFDVSPRTLAACAGLIEGVLVERRVSHARMRRFAREAAHVCHVVAERAFDGARKGPLHLLALAGPQRLHLRIVDRGRDLAETVPQIFSTQSRLFLDFRYSTPVEGVHVTEFAFAYAGSGVFVT